MENRKLISLPLFCFHSRNICLCIIYSAMCVWMCVSVCVCVFLWYNRRGFLCFVSNFFIPFSNLSAFDAYFLRSIVFCSTIERVIAQTVCRQLHIEITTCPLFDVSAKLELQQQCPSFIVLSQKNFAFSFVPVFFSLLSSAHFHLSLFLPGATFVVCIATLSYQFLSTFFT